MKPTVAEVWPQIMDEKPLKSTLDGVRVERVVLKNRERTIVVGLHSREPLDETLCAQLCLLLKPQFGSYLIRIENDFAYDALTPAAAAQLIQELKEQGCPIKGFLQEENPVEITPNGLAVHVKAGRNLVEQSDVAGKLAMLVEQRTGVRPNVWLEDTPAGARSENRDTEQEPAPAQKPLQPSTRPAAHKKTTRKTIVIPGVVLKNTPPRLFVGRDFTPGEIQPLRDLGEGGKVTVWGDVFTTQAKGSHGKITLISITDYTGSINLKVIPEEGTNAAKWEQIVPGTTLVVRGVNTYDKYERDYVILPSDVLIVERAPRTDTAPADQKRVELHLHTKSSALDAFCEPGKVIRLAHSMGHRAVAITDHGVCQAFPEAMLAADAIHKTDPNFKLIYGCEIYFVDDGPDGVAFCEDGQIADARGAVRGEQNDGVNRDSENDVLKKKYYHLIVLVKNRIGLKNLYRIVSEAHTKYFYKRPRVPRSLLNRYREGLLLGSACEAGELYRAIEAGTSREELERIAAYYDYLEIQPLENNAFLVRDGRVASVDSIKDFNKTVVDLGESLHLPVVATGDVHFQEPEDSIFRSVVQSCNNYRDADNQAPLYFRTTQDMLEQFAYLGEEKAKEVVVTNPGKIAATIENNLRAIPLGTYPPAMPGAETDLRACTWRNAKNAYGDPLPSVLQKRLAKELDSICGHGYAVLYMIAVKLVAFSNAGGYQVGSRGSVGSSAVAHFSGVSEVNSMPPHYLCPACRHSEWINDGVHMDGFDLPDKKCPVCGAPMKMDGHDIPFETFLGFYGDKEPDIDLNFSGLYQSSVHRYTEELFGKQNVFKAGTVSGLQDKTAYGYVKRYLEEHGKTVNRAEEDRLVQGCTGVKKTTGQHPGGMVVIPDDFDIYDFCPIQHPADDSKGGLVTTHFEFKYLHDTLLKLDELGHDVPTFYKYFEEYTGVSVDSIPMNDEKVYSLLTSPKALGVTAEQIGSETGTLGIPEMGTNFVRGMLLEAKPKNFSELIQISGLSHGTDVWTNNADELIRTGTCTIDDVIGCRDSIMLYLLRKGLEPKTAFDIMEAVRKGTVSREGFKPGWEETMREHGVPNWYMESCRKIKYMFPKAHAVAYLMASIRMMWYKIYYPCAFYAVYFTVRGADIDCEAAIGGVAVAREHIRKNEQIPKEQRTAKDDDALVSLELVHECLQRGTTFLPVALGKSYAGKYVLEGDKIRLPFTAIRGFGETAAQALENATMHGQRYLSIEELQQASGVASNLLDRLSAIGALGDLPKTNQVDLFSFS